MSAHTKYIMSMGEIKRKDNSLQIKNNKGNHYIPIEAIRELYLMNEVSLNTKFLDFISRTGVVIHFFNYYGQYSGTFYPKKQLISGKLTIMQAQAYLEKRSIIAKAIVQGIADNIYEVLYHYYRHGKKELRPTLNWLKNDVGKYLKIQNSNIKYILSVEGEIWRRFYESFKYFLPEDFILNKRVKRPPDNPINSMISFGNSILYTKTITQIYNTHLNQSISFLHEPSEGRFSLSLDLSEAFKPVIVYRTIFDLVNNKKIKVSKHFDKKLNYCLLNTEGRKIFIQAIESRLSSVFENKKLNRKLTYETAIKIDGYKLIKYIMEGKHFRPFSLKEMY